MVKNFKFIENVTEGVATIRLYDQIGNTTDDRGNTVYGISGQDFANALEWLENQVDEINIRINSIGGSVYDGYAIVSSILNCKKKVNTYIDGLAASTAGWIAVAGQKCYMMDYGTFMMHDPSGGDDKVLEVIKNTIVTILSNRTGMEPDECKKLMSKETWLDANKCKEKKIVDEIISSGKNVKINMHESLFNIMQVYNKALIKPQMNKVTNKLGLKPDATEEEILTAVNSLSENVVNLNNEIVKLKNENEAYKQKETEAANKAKAEREAAITAEIDEAVKSGKITAEERDSVLAQALASEESHKLVTNMLSKISTVVEGNKVFNNKGEAVDPIIALRKDWKFMDWSKNDPNGLLELKTKNFGYYSVLFKECYGSEPVK